MMSIDEAARKLQHDFQEASWFTSVGLGKDAGHDCIFLYVRSLQLARAAFPHSEWHGFPVVLRRMVEARPARRPMIAGGQDVRQHLSANRWTHESVRRLAGDREPVEVITEKARALVVGALDAGWSGPPYDPIELATNYLQLSVVASDSVPEARTVPTKAGPCIEFNPNRPRERRRYSVAHEIAHTLFPDCTDRVRHRGSHHSGADSQDWQLETLCNIAAAEILMPIGSVPSISSDSFQIERLVKLRPQFDVSMEAVVIRTVRIAEFPCAVFAASRVDHGDLEGTYQVDYVISSQAWAAPLWRGFRFEKGSVVGQCTAIGYTAKGSEVLRGNPWHVEAVGIPPFPGSPYPRVAGILMPADLRPTTESITYLTGNALEPRGTGLKVVTLLVNDATPNWGGRGFAAVVRRTWPDVQEDFQNWVAQSRENLRLGKVRVYQRLPDLAVASLVAQHGYGESSSPRVRYSALETCLREVAEFALAGGASVHMPRIGAGSGGGVWAVTQEIVLATLCRLSIPVTVYDLPHAQTPRQPTLAFTEK
jgi:O-acetyl-ADP-ribose deacetylase (regulator of RNase III)